MKKILYTLMASALVMSSCSDFLDRQPVDFPTEDNFYSDVKGLEGGVIGIYDALQSGDQYGGKFMTLMEQRGDNVKNDNSGASGGITYQIEVFTETPANTNLSGAWLSLYETIYRCNLVLQNVPNVEMTDTQRNNIVGQASFVRGLCYFNLVRLWGAVPVITQTQTVEEARKNKRDSEDKVYEQIIADFKAAKVLPAKWSDAERGRATSIAAQAMLAKAYLYQKKYSEALAELTTLKADIEQRKNGLALIPMDETFPNNLKTSPDIIFAVQYLKGGVGESVHQNNRYRNNDNGNVISLPQEAYETGDLRKPMVAPTGSGARPLKFNTEKEGNETGSDFPVMRCAEVMLMYAEASNEVSTTPGQDALDALNAVRENADLPAKTLQELGTKELFRKAVYHERRIELALECDRWFDIVRTNQMGDVFPMVDSYRKLYPVPQAEIENVNDKTGRQNDGYAL